MKSLSGGDDPAPLPTAIEEGPAVQAAAGASKKIRENQAYEGERRCLAIE